MNLLERYRYPIIGGIVGLIIAICIFTIGFWKMILLFLLIGLGIFVGLYLQRTGIIEQLLKKKSENTRRKLWYKKTQKQK